MKLTKEDYMKLGLERCAELLVEIGERDATRIDYIPFYPYNPTPTTPWYKHPYFIQEYTTTCKKED